MQSGQHQASLQAYAPTAGTLGQGDAANRKINIGDAVHDGEGRVGAGTIQEGAAIPRRGGGGGGRSTWWGWVSQASGRVPAHRACTSPSSMAPGCCSSSATICAATELMCSACGRLHDGNVVSMQAVVQAVLRQAKTILALGYFA